MVGRLDENWGVQVTITFWCPRTLPPLLPVHEFPVSASHSSLYGNLRNLDVLCLALYCTVVLQVSIVDFKAGAKKGNDTGTCVLVWDVCDCMIHVEGRFCANILWCVGWAWVILGRKGVMGEGQSVWGCHSWILSNPLNSNSMKMQRIKLTGEHSRKVSGWRICSVAEKLITVWVNSLKNLLHIGTPL